MTGDPMMMRLATVIAGLRLHIKTNGKMRLTRTATPKLLLGVATEFTGNAYKNTPTDRARALSELDAYKGDVIAGTKQLPTLPNA
jgi:hypothetical protein